MVHKLAIIAVIGLTGSAVCIGAAAAIGGKDAGQNIFGDDGSLAAVFGDRPRCEAVQGASATSRDLDWDGSNHVGLSVGGHAIYTPGSDNKVHVTGDPQTLAHLRVRDGNIELDCNGGIFRNVAHDVQITLPGQEFKKFGIAGSGNLLLQKLDQSMVKVSIAGSGSIKADGKVEHADIHIAGSGDADLGQVVANVATVHIAGSGNTDIAPSDEADIHIAGSGDVNLHSNPKRLETHIAGSGRIHNVSSGG
jgi:Putative auto-transporter adhesin, head GIN domain